MGQGEVKVTESLPQQQEACLQASSLLSRRRKYRINLLFSTGVLSIAGTCLWMTNISNECFNKYSFTSFFHHHLYWCLNVVSCTLNKFIVSILMIYSTSTESTDSRNHTLSKTEAAWDPATWHGIQWLTRFLCYLLADTEWVASSLDMKMWQTLTKNQMVELLKASSKSNQTCNNGLNLQNGTQQMPENTIPANESKA